MITITDDDKKAIAEMIAEEMDARRLKRMADAPPRQEPKKIRRLCLFTICDHGIAFPSGDARAILDKCFYAWATFSTERYYPVSPPEDVTIVAMGDGRKLATPFHALLLSGIVACVEVENAGLGPDPTLC